MEDPVRPAKPERSVRAGVLFQASCQDGGSGVVASAAQTLAKMSLVLPAALSGVVCQFDRLPRP